MIVIVLIILILVSIILDIYALDGSVDIFDESKNRKGKICGIISIVIIVVLVIIAITSIYTWNNNAKPTLSHQFKITAMRDNHEMYLNPCLFSVDGDTEVRYYYIRPYNGGVKEGYVPATRTIIYETDECEPHIECYFTERITSDEHPFLAKWYLQNDWNNTENYFKEYHVYIPKGTVVSDYSIDLKN